MTTPFYIAADHGGWELKNQIKAYLEKNGVQVTDLGTHAATSVDYPDFAHQLAEKVAADASARGILVCGTGIGMSISANRHAGVRAAVVTTPFMAQMAKQHNNANVLCLGARVIDTQLAMQLVQTWLTSQFEGGRHQPRLDKIERHG